MSKNTAELRSYVEPLTCASEWDALSAYERTKRVCHALFDNGIMPPNWLVIRDLISKGSGTDINRGKKDFLAEHSEKMKKMSGHIDGIPASLAPHVQAFWTEAVTFVTAKYEQDVMIWTTQIGELESSLELLQEKLLVEQERYFELTKNNESLIAQNALLKEQVTSEKSARESIESAFSRATQEMESQKNQLAQALENSKTELNAAIARLEVVENNAMVRIDRAKTEANEKIAAFESKATRDRGDHTIELNRANNQLKELREQLAESRGDLATVKQENKSLLEQQMKNEELIKQLLENNTSTKSKRTRIINPILAGKDTK